MKRHIEREKLARQKAQIIKKALVWGKKPNLLENLKIDHR